MQTQMDILLQRGLEKQIKIAGREYVYLGQTIRGIPASNMVEEVEYVNDVMPKVGITVWFSAEAVTKENPFKEGEYLESDSLCYRITAVRFMDVSPRRWEVVCTGMTDS
jgi:hypothetical protein